MKIFVGMLSMVMVSGCVATAKGDSFIGPSGTQVHTAKCSQSPQTCFKTAGDICRGAYAVVDSHSNAGGLLADILPGPVTWYTMVYHCGRAGGFSAIPFSRPSLQPSFDHQLSDIWKPRQLPVLLTTAFTPNAAPRSRGAA